ncbi:MAG: alpha/beta fold hydrolase [Deltaproteobacteria bacterium]|nr:MAG: alpha/beta fold hydrolase [Deltaproteobacteria bacterium]
MADLFRLLGLRQPPRLNLANLGSQETPCTFTQDLTGHSTLPDQTLEWHYSIFAPPNTPQAPTLYWSHGLGSSVAAERDFANALAAKGIRVVAIDYPGCGQSSWLKTHRGPLTAGEIQSLEDRERIFSIFLDGALNIIRHDRKKTGKTSFAIGGHSLGGVTSVRLAHHFSKDPLLLGLFNCVAFHSLGETHTRPLLLTLFLEILTSASKLQANFTSTPAVLAKFAIAYSGLSIANLSHGHSDVAELVKSTFEHLLRRPGESFSSWKTRIAAQEHALSTHARMSDFASTPEALRRLQIDQKALGKMPKFNVFAHGDPLLGSPERLAEDFAHYPKARAVVLKKSGRIPGPGHLALPSHPEPLARLFAGVINNRSVDTSDFRNAGIDVTLYQGNTVEKL